MNDFLLELLSEEIPARMQAKARNDLARLLAEELAKAGLAHDGIVTWSTPRRLALIARGVPGETEAVREEVKGPRASAPPQALEGFLRKTGLSRGDLEDRDGVLFAVIDRPGRPAGEVLGEAVATVVREFPWPKSMRWGPASASMSALRWVRPLHAIVAILGEEVVPVAIEGVRCGATTLGHRFHHPGPITIGGAFDYAEKLRACHVIVDHEEREAIVRDGARAGASAVGLTLVEDEGLVVENAGLTEWPVPLLGKFDPDFLDVPREVIVLTMRTNQKYFACARDDGGLAPAFVCTANIAANDGGAAIVEGNRRVLAARLSDARFFWEQDLKVPLAEQSRKLSGIVFHEKLGTVADKVERVAKLARWLVEEGIVTPAKAGAHLTSEGQAHTDQQMGSRPRGNDDERTALANMAERAARLAKADLVTGMVGEFPELQGIIGGYLAAAQGEPREVSDAIRDHYGAPPQLVAIAVALADKMDTIAGFFLIDEQPTGSKDPFAVRRAALGVITILVENEIQLSLVKALMNLMSMYVETALAWGTRTNAISQEMVMSVRNWSRLKNLASQVGVVEGVPPRPEFDLSEFLGLKALMEALMFPTDESANVKLAEIMNFFAERLRVQQRDLGVRHDLINAVYAHNFDDDLVRLLARVRALQGFVETGEGRDLLAGYKRAANILAKDGFSPTRHPGLEPGPGYSEQGSPGPDRVRADELGSRHDLGPVEETALRTALGETETRADAAIAAEDFTAAMAALASLRAPIDAFFEKVTVNDPDPATRARRLALLARFRDAVHRVADFSRIEG